MALEGGSPGGDRRCSLSLGDVLIETTKMGKNGCHASSGDGSGSIQNAAAKRLILKDLSDRTEGIKQATGGFRYTESTVTTNFLSERLRESWV